MGSVQTVAPRKYQKVSALKADDSFCVGCVSWLRFSWVGLLKDAYVTSVCSPRASKQSCG